MGLSVIGTRVLRRSRSFRFLTAVVVCSLAAVNSTSAAPHPQDPVPVSAASQNSSKCGSGPAPDTKTLGTVSPPDQCEYAISVPADSYQSIFVRQTNGSVNVRIFFDSADSSPDERFSDLGKNSVIRIALLAKGQPRTIRIVILSRQAKSPSAWEIEASSTRAATPGDELRVKAESVSAQADQFLRKNSPETLKQSLDSDDEALKLWRDLKDNAQIRARLIAKGRAYLSLRDYPRAREILTEATAVPSDPHDRPGEESAFKILGFADAYLGDAQSATEAYNRALTIARGEDDTFNQAVLLSNVARAYRILGSNTKALRTLDEGLTLAQRLEDHNRIAHTLEEIGNVQNDLGQPQKALDAYRNALAELKFSPEPQLEAHLKNGMGYVLAGLGDDEQARELYRDALKIWIDLKDKVGEAYTLNNSGLLYAAHNEWKPAREQYQKALDNLTELHLDRERATVLVNLGLVYQRMNQPNTALEYMNYAVEAEGRAPDRAAKAYILTCKGEVLATTGDSSGAFELYREALALRRDSQDLNGQAEALADIARLDRQSDLEGARKNIEEALGIIESTRNTLSSQQLKLTYFAKKRDFYEFYVDLLMEMHQREPNKGFATLALEATERARSRNLVDSLRESGIDLRQAADGATVAQEQGARERLDAITRQLAEKSAAKETDPAALENLKKDLQFAVSEYDNALRALGAQIPRYAALTGAAPFHVADVQRELLDENTTLLEYWLGAKKSYVWVISRNEISSFVLPPSAMIQEDVAKLRVAITARAQHIPQESAEQYSARIAKASRESANEIAHLSLALLKPAATHLHGKRLAIVGDASLLWLPFEVLALNTASIVASTNQKRTVGNSFDVVYLPSLTALQLLRSDASHEHSTASRLAVFADPVYNSDDPRIHSKDSSTVASGKKIARSRGTDSNLLPPQPPSPNTGNTSGNSLAQQSPDHFLRLRYSRREAEAIAEFLPPDRRTLELDFAANRDTFEHTDWSSYTALHLATHALVNGVHPDLSGIVLSLVDEQGHAEDGFVHMHDIYNLRIPVDFVVLSGCQTALGQEIRGEGLVGLSRAFFYAGTHRVIGTLWNVDDQASSVFMQHFYEGMFKEHLTPPSALRAAQVKMSHLPRWHDPYYWAGFVLEGDWK